MFTTVGKFLDHHWPVALAIVGSLMVAIPPMFFDRTKVDDFWMVVIVGAGVIAVAASQIVQSRRAGNLAKRLRQTAEDAREDQLTLYEGVLVPMIEQLYAVSSAKAKDRASSYASLVARAVGEASGYLAGVAEEPVKVNYYRLGGEPGSEYLEVAYITRTVRRKRLDRSTVEGTIIVSRTLRGEDVYCEDLATDTAQADASEHHDYKCFVSVSVTASDHVYGMLSANAVNPGSIPQSAKAFLKVVGTVLAVAEEAVGEVTSREIVRP